MTAHASSARPRPTATRGHVEVTPIQCTGATVRRLARRITSFYEQHLLPSGLKLSQYSVLAHLSERPQSLLALSRRLEMDRTTLTRNLKPLLANRWIAEVGDTDARRRLLMLTPSGTRVRRQARVRWKSAQLALEKQLGRNSVARLHAQLDAALERLKAVLPKEN